MKSTKPRGFSAYSFDLTVDGDPEITLQRVRAHASRWSGDADSGTVAGDSPLGAVELSYQRLADQRTWRIAVVSKPWLVSNGRIESKVREWFQS